jgi:hypothetical protein
LAARKRIDEAIANFRTEFKKNAADFEPGYEDALNYFTTLASLTRLMKWDQLEARPRTVTELCFCLHEKGAHSIAMFTRIRFQAARLAWRTNPAAVLLVVWGLFLIHCVRHTAAV